MISKRWVEAYLRFLLRNKVAVTAVIIRRFRPFTVFFLFVVGALNRRRGFK